MSRSTDTRWSTTAGVRLIGLVALAWASVGGAGAQSPSGQSPAVNESTPPAVAPAPSSAPAEKVGPPVGTPTTSGQAPSLSERLGETNGVITPPPSGDQRMQVAPPNSASRTPVIPPPGSPGGDPTLQPK